jgi:hypothetical protein
MATTTFDNLITFSRGSNATVTGPNGLIQWAPNNLVTNSQDFEAAAWVKAQTTVTANAATAPDGTLTADKILETAVTNVHAVYANFTYIAGTVYAASVYAKAAERSWIYLGADTSAAEAVFFDLSTGTVGNQGTGYVGSIQSVGDGWYRCTVIITQSTALPPNYFVVGVASANNTASYAGVATSGVFIWGAQLELGSTATTYNNTSVRNLLGFSEAFDNAAWTKTRASMVTGAQANPVNGLFNAQKLMEDTTASSTHFTSQAFTAVVVPYVMSVYAKKAERQRITLRENSASGDAATFDLNSGTVVANFVGGVGSIQSVGNGWYRCSVLFTGTAGGRSVAVLLNTNTGSGFESYTGDGNSGVYIYGAMLSNSASLDPYVPTPGAAPSSTAYYGPRFDYDPVTLLPRGLLIEEQRANLATYSEQFNDAIWTKTRTSVSVNTTAAPDGTTTADTLVEDTTASNTHVLNRILGNPLAAATYTYSIYAKAAGRRYIELILIVDPASTNVRYATMFDLQTGTITTTSSASSPTATANAIQAAGNGWYRCVVTIGNPSGLRVDVSHALSDTPTAPALAVAPAYTGDGVSGAFIWGAQLEAGAFATSYIPTIASTVTRSADIATITGSLFSQWYNQQTGSFIAEWAINNANSTGRYIVKAFSPSVAQGYGLWLNSNSIDTRAWIGATSITAGNATLSTANKAAFGYRAGDNAASVNGIAAVASSATGPTDATYLEIGSAGASYFNGHIRSIRYVPVRAADFQLQQVTT